MRYISLLCKMKLPIYALYDYWFFSNKIESFIQRRKKGLKWTFELFVVFTDTIFTGDLNQTFKHILPRRPNLLYIEQRINTWVSSTNSTHRTDTTFREAETIENRLVSYCRKDSRSAYVSTPTGESCTGLRNQIWAFRKCFISSAKLVIHI